ncbi:orotidine-5'-phosphate decarboxylase [Chryseomicrobium palamuruense]|uniref:Orotidine 5'-phosphate decarboxylase n=1 Tax=Chryseomicrobium palamuruense TaxID=682973 RepID=A0ABV8USX9_9BACL
MTKPILALDFSEWNEVEQFLKRFDEPLFVKVGMELYLQHGPRVIQELKSRGHELFLDLKLHDIPTTVYKAMRGLAKLDVDLINVHAAGGIDMMRAAKEGLEEGAQGVRPDLIAVTQLTSTTEASMQKEQGIPWTLDQSVLHYAENAKIAGLDGVVCSVLEAKRLTENLGTDFYKVTPGIRLAEGAAHDQKRVATPEEARNNGSTHIVVGRAITQASDPVAVYQQLVADWRNLQ